MRKKNVLTYLAITLSLMTVSSCGAKTGTAAESVPAESVDSTTAVVAVPDFSADSAYSYLRRQVEFGPRVPNSEAHRKTGDWLVSELKRHGAEVHEQKADLTAFDGTVLHARNIYGRYNPSVKENRLLLLAHYDTRPWADQDPDASKRDKPNDGANDGASGVAVILETARNIAARNPGYGIDILFTDAEDYGTDDNEESWAMGVRYFAENMRNNGWYPDRAILLDMVGGKDALFPYEYYSRQTSPKLDRAFRNAAAAAGYAATFPESYGGAVTDDHVELIKAGVNAIDIIEYHPQTGFNPTWHTHADNLDNISATTLKAVGQSLLQYIYN